MSRALICDRCGKLIKDYNGDRRIGKANFQLIWRCQIPEELCGSETHYDLCPDCAEAFMNFIVPSEQTITICEETK